MMRLQRMAERLLGGSDPVMSLPGPSRTITVEPIERPSEQPEPLEEPMPDTEREPVKEPEKLPR